jgi:hypothetical protein
MLPARNPDTVALDLALRPYELVAAWRTASRTLVVPVAQPVRALQRVEARISLLGHGLCSTILGIAVAVRPHPLGVELELEPDALRELSLERLVQIAAGARVTYRSRAPRWLAEVPAYVDRLLHPRRTTTFSVSENGCALAWSGPMPAIGTRVEVHLGTGRRHATFRGEVCWRHPFGRVPALGLRFATGDRESWAEILADVRRGGAPPA